MTAATANPFQGKARADGGGDFKTEIPSEDTHEARVVALIDLGTHKESFQGGPEKLQRKVYLVYELDEEMTGMKGTNHVVGVRYTLSFHEKSNLRQLAEAILNEGVKYKPDEAYSYGDLLGQPCTVQIAHDKKTTEKGERIYARVGTIAAVGKKARAKVFAAKRELAEWYVGHSSESLPDYLPRIYGEEVTEVIGRCQELALKAASEGEGEAPSGRNEPPF